MMRPESFRRAHVEIAQTEGSRFELRVVPAGALEPTVVGVRDEKHHAVGALLNLAETFGWEHTRLVTEVSLPEVAVLICDNVAELLRVEFLDERADVFASMPATGTQA